MANLYIIIHLDFSSRLPSPHLVLLPSMPLPSAGSYSSTSVVTGGRDVVSPPVSLVVGGSPAVGAGSTETVVLSDAV